MPNQEIKIVIGNLDAKIAKKRDDEIVSKFGIGTHNERENNGSNRAGKPQDNSRHLV